jgi:hypothetical protein
VIGKEEAAWHRRDFIQFQILNETLAILNLKTKGHVFKTMSKTFFGTTITKPFTFPHPICPGHVLQLDITTVYLLKAKS